MTFVVQRENPSWVRYIHHRIDRNKNICIFVGGEVGSGKSMSCLTIAKMVDPDFNEDRVVFSGKELLDLVNSGNLKRGSAIVFEEAGVMLSSKNWQSTINKMLNFLLQTWRHKNYVLLLNAPHMDFLDASVRKLLTAEFQTMRIDVANKKVIIKPQLLQYNGRYQKWYYKYLRVITPNGAYPVTSWGVPLPDKELIKNYQIKKSAFTDGLNKEIYDSIVEVESAGKNSKKKQMYTCRFCAYEWHPRGSTVPNKCPGCRKLKP